MLKQNDREKPQAVFGRNPGPQRLEIAPVDDLVSAMEYVNARTIEELNEQRMWRGLTPNPCSIDCKCGPCRVGDCGNCDADQRALSYAVLEFQVKL
jgi:hypothetical protein